jgi:hypothetical protein
MIKKIVLIEWVNGDGMAQEIHLGICENGYDVQLQTPDQPIPEGTDLLLSYGPYGSLFQIVQKLKAFPHHKRPLYMHWDTEGMPDFRMPGPLIQSISGLRSWYTQRLDEKSGLRKIPFLSFLDKRMHRFRYFGDYHRAYRQGWLDALFEYSLIYTEAHRRCGLPAIYMPWGTAAVDYVEMDVKRDIDVVWLGKPRSRRRNLMIADLRTQLTRQGYSMLIFDGVERPYIFGRERSELLNRTKVTLNLLPYWDFNNFPFKFHLAAGNRSLVVSEAFLRHNPEYIPGFHYVETPAAQLLETIKYYLHHEDERSQIAQNAFELATQQMTMANNLQILLKYAESRIPS